MPKARQQPDQLSLIQPPKPTRAERSAQMDEEILDVDGAARALGVSTRTIYSLARKGELPAMRVGREWRFSLRNLREWVANASQAMLRNGRVVRQRT